MSTTGQPEQRQRHPALRVHLLEQARENSAELLQKVGHLKELVEHPGWPVLKEFVGIQAAHLRAKVDRDPVRMAGAIAKDPTTAAVKLALAGAEAEGLGRVVDLVGASIVLADQLERSIEQGDEGDQR